MDTEDPIGTDLQDTRDTLGDRARGVSLLRLDPALARSLSPSDAASAERLAHATVVSLPKGVFWPNDRFPNERGALGMLVLDGLLLRGVTITDRPTLEVLGPGDVFRPFELERNPYAVVSPELRWWALRPARVAVLDAGFIRRMGAHPEVITELVGRLSRRAAASSLRLAIVREPRLSVRLHWTLWQLANRFGETGEEGTWLRLPVCHTLLSWLVGARRPALSRAINELERTQCLTRRSDGTWWLAGEPPRGLGVQASPVPAAA